MFGDRASHIKFGDVFTCHCGLPFPSLQHIAVHHLTCTVQQPMPYGPSLNFWYIFGWGRDFDQMNFLYSRANISSWLAVSTSSSKAFLTPLSSAACMQPKKSSSIAIVRMSSSYDNYEAWSESMINSIATWTQEHDLLFHLDGDPRILGVAVSSRIFPLIPSPAVQKYLSVEFAVRQPIPAEVGCLSAIEWSAQLVGMIKDMKQRRADKPAVASVRDGLTSILAHLAVLCFSAESFHFDCKVKIDARDSIRRTMDESEYDDWESSLTQDDAKMKKVRDGA